MKNVINVLSKIKFNKTVTFVSVYWSFGSHVCYVMGGVLLVIPYMVLNTKPKSQ